MRILLVMDPGIPIPVTGYGGIERIVELLAKEYMRQGHEVHLLVTDKSYVDGCIMHELGPAGFPPKKAVVRNAIFKAWKFLFLNRRKFDLIHNFGRLIYLLPVLNSPIRKIMSYQREITKRNIEIFNFLPNRNIIYTGCSKDLIERADPPGKWKFIHNGCNFDNYDLKEEVQKEAPLIFLGRIERVKGCHVAIELAKSTGNKLVIAGNISPLPDEAKYYKDEIEPKIDGKQILYIGTLNDVEKNKWLGESKAMVFPIEWNEPFGIVMIESMACGTPVIAFPFGSVNEVIDEGITGYKVKDLDSMIKAVGTVSTMDRVKCRNHAIARFNISAIAQKYLTLHTFEMKAAD